MNEEIQFDDNNSSSIQSTDDKNAESKLRFPYVVIVILFLFIAFLLYFYFVLIKPENLFSKVFKFQFSVLKNSIIHKSVDYDSIEYIVNSEFNTDGSEYLKNIDGLKYLFEIGYDSQSTNYKLDISSNINSLKGKDKIKYNEDITSSYYYYDQSIYLKPYINVIKTNTNGDSSDNTEKIIDLFEEVLFEVIDDVDINSVKRSIVTKKVKGQSLLAIQYSTSFDNETINDLLDKTVDNLLDSSIHPNFVNEVADNLNISREEAIEKISSYKNYNIKSKDIKFNYYLNLAFNNLVSFELEIDDIKFNVSYLSGYYFINLESDNLNCEISYNIKTGDVSGDLKFNYLKVDGIVNFDSIVMYDEKHNVIGNNIVIRFYDKSKDNEPFLIVDNDIKYLYNRNIEFFDSSDVISFNDANGDDITKSMYIKDKIIYESLYLVGVYVYDDLGIIPDEFVY